MKFFLLGDNDVILGFQFIGIKGKAVDNEDDTRREFYKIINGEYGEVGVLLITEKIGMFLEEEIIDWQLQSRFPLVVEIPDLDGQIEGKKTLLQSIREAIGLPV